MQYLRDVPLSREFAVRNDHAAMTPHVRSGSSVVRFGMCILSCGESAHRSFAQPLAAFTLRQRDAQRRAKRGAEAPGQRTAASRLLRRVGQPRPRAVLIFRFGLIADG
jgi:hypothetical protein